MSENPGIKRGYVFGRRYAWYALFLLMLVAAFNLIDRMIITILAGEIKADLALSDSELGLLLGTFFAIFYSLFGIPLGSLGDNWVRTRLIPIGLAGWSFMTLLSGLATNLLQFSLTRIGVGIGEASSGPAATSLLSDYFPRRMRGTALALYSCGISIGIGFSLWLGGAIVEQWKAWYPLGGYPLGLKGWQVALITVALPGMLLAVFVARLKEPPRGVSDGVIQRQDPHPFRKCWQDFIAVIPPFTFYNFTTIRASGRVWAINLAALLALAVVVAAVTTYTNGLVPPEKNQIYATWGGVRITTNAVQWSALAFGLYCVFSWAQSISFRDAPTYELILKTPVTLSLIAAGALFMTMTNGLMAWVPYFLVTRYDETIATVGLKFGFVSAVAGLSGTALGGVIGDAVQKRSPRGRLYVSLFAMVVPAPLAWLTLTRDSLNEFLACFVFLAVVTTSWLPGMLSTIQDLVMPRMRGLVYALFVLGMTIIGLGAGPYVAGLISDSTGDLGRGILSLYLLTPLILVLMLFSIRNVDSAVSSKVERAVAAGEVLTEKASGAPGAQPQTREGP